VVEPQSVDKRQKPLRRKIWAAPSRYDSKARGEWFVTWLITALAGLTVVYILLHLFVERRPNPQLEHIARLEENGRVTLLDAFALDWFVGGSRAKPILERTAKRFEEMEQLRLDTERVMATLRQRGGADFVTSFEEIEQFFSDSNFKEAFKKFGLLTEGLARTTREGVLGENSIGDFRARIQRLVFLKTQQENDLAALRPSATHSIFWTDPIYSLAEVLFFALFGVLTNLLMQTAQYLRKGNYKASERWVGYTKLAYGPFLALIVVLAIMNGWIDPQYETRVWTLPLVGFILGYASRRTAALVDRVSEAFLGKTSESIEKGPDAAAAARLERANALLEAAQPRSLADIKLQGGKLLEELVNAQVAKKEAQA
jgi:hypothetical protein